MANRTAYQISALLLLFHCDVAGTLCRVVDCGPATATGTSRDDDGGGEVDGEQVDK